MPATTTTDMPPPQTFEPALPERSGQLPADWGMLELRLTAVANADRLRILHLMRDGKMRGPKSLAQELDATLGVVSYHIRFMAERGMLELVETRPARGAVAHYYVLSKAGHEIRKALRL